jgi:hypothetical protein
MPTTDFQGGGIPLRWADVMLKGTYINVCHALATRSVTVPRWTGNDMPLRDESHLQQSWEQMASIIKPDYEEERAYLKGEYLGPPQITVDPFMGLLPSGSYAGMTGVARLNYPTWYSSMNGSR